MANPVSSMEVQSILGKAKNRPLDRETYLRIAHMFTENTMDIPVQLLSEMVQVFISAQTVDPIYVNEIKHFLEIHNKELYGRYASLFSMNPGAPRVFGTGLVGVPSCPVIDAVTAERPEVEDGEDRRCGRKKEYNGKKSRRPKNLVRKRAREAAYDEYRKRIARKADKRASQSKFEEMMRREGGA